MVLWSFWEDYDEQGLSTWPWIVGKIKIGELAFVIEIFYTKNSLHGAKIITQSNLMGWINTKCLKKVVIPVGVEPTPP